MKTPFFQTSAAVLLVVAMACTRQPQSNELQRSTPESQGVSSAGISDFMNAVDTSGVEIHSFMFLRHGRVVAEGWWKPYGPGSKHLMYSASKTFTATAIGLLANEGKLKLDDKVTSFFPASVPDTLHDYMKAMTVRHLLMMSTGQDAEPRRGQNDDWIRSFLAKDPVDEPGTIFRYNNTATFMLSAIVQQVSGETLYNYLKPRIFLPLGFTNVDWDLNSQGINLGMIGLRLHTEDMAKFGQLLLQNGNWNGQQLIPESWVAEATSKKIDSKGGNANLAPENNDWMQGYCYQMWRCRNNGVRLDGMAGQFVLILPDLDAVIALTANAQNTQKELDLVWNYLLPAIKSESPVAEDPTAFAAMTEKASTLQIAPQQSAYQTSPTSEKISGKTFELEDNAYGIREMVFDFSREYCLITYRRDGGMFAVKAGQGSWEYSDTYLTSLLGPQRPPAQKSRDANYAINQPVIRVAASYRWTDEYTLELTARFVEEALGSEGIVVKFSEKAGKPAVSVERRQNRPGGTPGPGFPAAALAPVTGKVK